MKNCMVISGQFRTFRDTVNKMKQFIDINKLDVYAFLWSDDVEEKRFVLEQLKPVNYRFEKYSAYKDIFDEIEKRVRENNPKNAPNDKVAGNASMNFARKQAYSLIREDYDNIFYCRYDIDIIPNWTILQQPDAILTPIEESYNLISDIFAIIPTQYAPYYFLYDDYERLHSTQFEPAFEEWLRSIKQYGEENIRIHKYERYCPHMMLLRHLWNNNVPVKMTDLNVSIKR